MLKQCNISLLEKQKSQKNHVPLNQIFVIRPSL